MSGELTAITGLLIGIVSIVFAGLIWLIKKQFDQSNTTIKDSNIANKNLADSLEKLMVVLNNQHESYVERDKRDQAFQEDMRKSFKSQNDSLAEVVKTQKRIIKTQDRNYKAVINTQKIKTQTVEKQIVSEEQVKKKA